MNLDVKPAREYDVTVIPVGTETFLVKRSEAFKVNRVGLRIWNALEGEKSIQEIVQDVVQFFDVDEATATDDAMVFISELKNRRLVDFE